MFKRLELHNHTTESDASISCEELVKLMEEDGVHGFALTDHNTISGHRKVKKLLRESSSPISCIYGMEYTTYYGHILCHNLTEYVPWENINKHKPELLFRSVKEKGAVIGIAHPFSYGWPFAQGCRFEMKVSDYSSCDFIEIFNNPEPLYEVNKKGLELWETLVLRGEKLAATCGMDLHGRASFHGQYATYIEGKEGGDLSLEYEDAIKSLKTWVSKGPLLLTEVSGDSLRFSLHQTGKPGYQPLPDTDYIVSLKTAETETSFKLSDSVSLTELGSPKMILPKLYERTEVLENLVCVSPVLRI